jgi:hypothetical protein
MRRGPFFYAAGGGTHPGGGVPLVMLSGRFAASALLSELNGRSGAKAQPARSQRDRAA